MRNIHPTSALDNYNEIIDEVSVGNQVFLEENGKVEYAILDMEDHEKTQAIIKIFSELVKTQKPKDFERF